MTKKERAQASGRLPAPVLAVAAEVEVTGEEEGQPAAARGAWWSVKVWRRRYGLSRKEMAPSPLGVG